MNDSGNSLNGTGSSTLVSRNITVLGHRTSVRLEPEMWNALREIAKREQCKIHDICSLISLRKNVNTSLTAAIRVFLMLYYRAAATDDGHRRAAHGSFENMMSRARMTPEMLAVRISANTNGRLKERFIPPAPQVIIPSESLPPGSIQ